jgi:hypothetical protein
MSKPENTSVAPRGLKAGGCLIRLGWTLLGSVALFFSAVAIAYHGGLLSVADGVFWGTVAACIVLRYVDVRMAGSQTVMGGPATLSHWRRYVVFMIVVGAAVWGLAHAVAYLSE